MGRDILYGAVVVVVPDFGIDKLLEAFLLEDFEQKYVKGSVYFSAKKIASEDEQRK